MSSTKVNVIGVIADRAHIAKAHEVAEELCKGRCGDGWIYGVKLFEGLKHPYLFMLAEDRERCRIAAPLVMTADSFATLYEAVGRAADRVRGAGVWFRLTDEDTNTNLRLRLSRGAEDGKVTEYTPSGAVHEYRDGVRAAVRGALRA